MARDSKNKPAAWTLIQYLVGRQGMSTWTSLGLAMPTRTDIKAIGGRRAFLGQAKDTPARQIAPGFSKEMDSAGNQLSAVVSGSESGDTTLNKIPDLANQTLKT